MILDRPVCTMQESSLKLLLNPRVVLYSDARLQDFFYSGKPLYERSPAYTQDPIFFQFLVCTPQGQILLAAGPRRFPKEEARFLDSKEFSALMASFPDLPMLLGNPKEHDRSFALRVRSRLNGSQPPQDGPWRFPCRSLGFHRMDEPSGWVRLAARKLAAPTPCTLWTTDSLGWEEVFRQHRGQNLSWTISPRQWDRLSRQEQEAHVLRWNWHAVRSQSFQTFAPTAYGRLHGLCTAYIPCPEQESPRPAFLTGAALPEAAARQLEEARRQTAALPLWEKLPLEERFRRLQTHGVCNPGAALRGVQRLDSASVSRILSHVRRKCLQERKPCQEEDRLREALGSLEDLTFRQAVLAIDDRICEEEPQGYDLLWFLARIYYSEFQYKGGERK